MSLVINSSWLLLMQLADGLWQHASPVHHLPSLSCFAQGHAPGSWARVAKSMIALANLLWGLKEIGAPKD